MLSLEEKVAILANDYDLEDVVNDNDMEIFDVIMLLVNRGRINLDLYFTEDQLEMEE